MRWFLFILSIVALSGCDTINRDQLFVRAENHSRISTSLEATVTNSISDYVGVHGLVDKSNDMTVEGGLLFYQTNDEYFPITLGARRVNDGIVIDLIHFHPGTGETMLYSKIKKDLLDTLENENGVAVTLLPYEKHYEISRGKR